MSFPPLTSFPGSGASFQYKERIFQTVCVQHMQLHVHRRGGSGRALAQLVSSPQSVSRWPRRVFEAECMAFACRNGCILGARDGAVMQTGHGAAFLHPWTLSLLRQPLLSQPHDATMSSCSLSPAARLLSPGCSWERVSSPLHSDLNVFD